MTVSFLHMVIQRLARVLGCSSTTAKSPDAPPARSEIKSGEHNKCSATILDSLDAAYERRRLDGPSAIRAGRQDMARENHAADAPSYEHEGASDERRSFSVDTRDSFIIPAPDFHRIPPNDVRLKPQWESFRIVVNRHKIKWLYHFTDQANLQSIIRHGGLYSWHRCESLGIKIARPGGDSFSRTLDKAKGLEDHVRLSLSSNPPMLKSALASGRIVNPVILKVCPTVIYWRSTLFSDVNAAAGYAKIGRSFDVFLDIRFETAMGSGSVTGMDYRWRQAEVLVEGHVPLELIKIPHSHGV